MEEFRIIQEFPNYAVSTLGRVKNLSTGRILKQSIDRYGYKFLELSNNGFTKTRRVHTLVACAFLPKDESKYQVNHKDEDPTNNRVENLEWCDDRYNSNYGTRSVRSGIKRRKGVEQLTLEGILLREFDTLKEAAQYVNGTFSTIAHCCQGKYKQAYGYKWRYKRNVWKEKK